MTISPHLKKKIIKKKLEEKHSCNLNKNVYAEIKIVWSKIKFQYIVVASNKMIFE